MPRTSAILLSLCALMFSVGTAQSRVAIQNVNSGAPVDANVGKFSILACTLTDVQGPAAVLDLAALDSTVASVTLQWTAPADPPSNGAAYAYAMRRWTDGGSWNISTPVAGLPAPSTPGVQQSIVVGSLTPGTLYHFQIRSRDASGNWSALSNEAEVRTLAVTGAADEAGHEPRRFVLKANVPNPTSGPLTVRYELPVRCHVELGVYDVGGREVRHLVSREQGAGRYSVRWDGRTQDGAEAPAGVYFTRLRAGSVQATSRAVVVR